MQITFWLRNFAEIGSVGDSFAEDEINIKTDFWEIMLWR
jgi:hypothetical protein